MPGEAVQGKGIFSFNTCITLKISKRYPQDRTVQTVRSSQYVTIKSIIMGLELLPAEFSHFQSLFYVLTLSFILFNEEADERQTVLFIFKYIIYLSIGEVHIYRPYVHSDPQ